MLKRARHGVIRRLGVACRFLHGVERGVVFFCAGLDQGHSAQACCLAAPQIFKCVDVSVYGLHQDLEHVIQAGTAGHELRKTLSGLFLYDRRNVASLFCQLVEHGRKIGRAVGCVVAVGSQDRVGRTQIVEIDIGSRGNRDHAAHVGSQIRDGRFAKILRGNQSVSDFVGLAGIQLVGIECRGQDIDGCRRVGKAARSQPRCSGNSFHDVGGLDAARECLVDRLGDVLRCHACGIRQRQDVRGQLVVAHAGFVRQCFDLGECCLILCSTFDQVDKPGGKFFEFSKDCLKFAFQVA